MNQAVEGDNEKVEVVELDDSSMSEGNLKDQTRLPVLVHLLLALAGTRVLKQGLSGSGSSSSASVDLGFSVDILFFLWFDVIVLTFIFCIFLKLIICYIVIGCYKRVGLHQDLIIGALIWLYFTNFLICDFIKFKNFMHSIIFFTIYYSPKL